MVALRCTAVLKGISRNMSGPAVAMVAMHFAERALAELIATGLLVKGKEQGKYYYHASVYFAGLFEDSAVAYTAEVV